ncbi:acyl carrier protein [Cytophaga sp. FL35]|uniref:acyl carrier protein n=1 Tax=Cytophaga sp. FL35 TaxID=1904456 RepID=UPI0016539027|nr:acyl carrier protein [Cytophaga sp. FL35]MBC6998006.1 acyl carrier protein [Cytophaga sp. FL35]
MKDKISNYIIHHIAKQKIEAIHADDDLLADGLIDSLGMMKLVAYVEKEAQIKIPPEDLTLENFMTIDHILEYLANHSTT